MQVNQNYMLLTKNTLKRMKLLVKAICEEDMTSTLALISHAKSMVTTRTKLLQAITRLQVSPTNSVDENPTHQIYAFSLLLEYNEVILMS